MGGIRRCTQPRLVLQLASEAPRVVGVVWDSREGPAKSEIAVAPR